MCTQHDTFAAECTRRKMCAPKCTSNAIGYIQNRDYPAGCWPTAVGWVFQPHCFKLCIWWVSCPVPPAFCMHTNMMKLSSTRSAVASVKRCDVACCVPRCVCRKGCEWKCVADIRTPRNNRTQVSSCSRNVSASNALRILWRRRIEVFRRCSFSLLARLATCRRNSLCRARACPLASALHNPTVP